MATYQLFVNGREVVTQTDDEQPTIGASLQSVRVAYVEPRELRFMYYGDDDVLGAEVQLYVDGVVRFDGQVLERQRAKNFGKPHQCVAFGLEEKLNDVRLTDPDSGYPTWRFADESMSDALSALFASDFGEQLRAIGISGALLAASSDMIPATSIRSGGFADALEQIANAIPGFVWLVDPSTKQVVLIDVYNAPTMTIGTSSSIVKDHAITESLRDRYTAVTLMGVSEAELALAATAIYPAWNSELESVWTGEQARALTSNNGAVGGMADVYRKYSCRHVLDNIVDTQPVTLVQEVVQYGGDSRFYVVEVEQVDLTNGYIWAKQPMIQPAISNRAAARNMRIAGKSRPASGVYLRYYRLGSSARPGFRQPLSGYAGTAFTSYNVQRAKIIHEASNDNITSQRAKRMLDANCDTVYEGTVTIGGDVPSRLWNLGHRINVSYPGVVTGYENMRAILTSFTHDFRQRQTVLELSSNRSPFAGQGVD